VENLLKENKNYSEIKTIQDFSGNDRCVIAKVGKI
jgi:methylase of polypeptide subunit release factors